MTSNLLSHFKINLLNPVNPVNPENPGPDIGDIAYSLQVGRKAFDHRRMLVCSGTAEAAAALSEPDSRKVRTGTVMEENPSVVFMFSGLGAQYVNMGRELYQTQPVFREEMDRCFEILKPLMDCDIKDILYPGGGDHTGSPVQGDVIQPVVFIFEYALAKMVTAWGIQPYAVIGYSFGEYTAACFAGVLSLEDALKLVVLRSRLVQTTSPGAMLSVPLPEKDVLPLLDSFGGGSLSLSIDNGPSCVVSSPVDRVEAFETWMKEKKYLCTRLPLSRAIHSHLMDPILEEFRETVSGFMLNEPQIPYISNVTGNWLENKDAVDAGYWATHLRGTVRFADGVKTMLNDHPHSIFLEVGPGYDLCTLLRHFLPPGEGGETRVILNLVEQARVAASESHSDTRYLLNRLGRLWLSGVAVDWSRFYAEEKRRRVPLPVYPFEGKRYWIDGDPFKAGAIQTPPEAQSERKTAIDDWFYCPSWKQVPQPRRWAKKVPEKVCWLVFADETGLGDRFAQRLRRDGHVVAIVRQGTGFAGTGESGYTVNPREHQDYNSLFSHLGQADKTPGKIVHFWSVTNEEKEVEKIQELGFYSLIHIAQAAGKQSFSHRIQLAVISNGLHRVTSEETLCPAKATILGAVKVIPKEYFNIGCRSIDILLPGPGGPKEELLPEQLQTEMFIELPGSSQKVVAYRGDYRWVQVYEPLSIETYEEQKPLLKAGGVYLILGGLGGIGLELAGYLTGKVRAKLVLTHRSDFPSKDQWREWLKTHDDEDPVSGKIRKVQRLEELGAEVLVCRADAADEQRMRDAVNRAVEWFGGIDGVIHAAGLAGGGMIPLRTPGTIEPVLVAKVQGTLVLDRVLNEKNIKPGFIVLCSSLSGVLGFFGQVGYCAANAFLDAYAHQKTYEQDVFTLSIDWDFWKEVGMGVETVKQLVENQNITDAEALLSFGIEPSEGISIFDRLLHGGYPQVIVSTWDLSARIKSLEKETGTGGEDDPEAAFAGTSHPRPDLSTEYEPPESEFEKNFAGILQKFFGFDRVGIHDNLFEYGITSLDMIHINNVLTKKIETDIPIVVMFEYPTIHALGQYLGLCDNAGSTAGGEDSQVEDLDEVEDLLHQSLDVFGEE
ncbi:MAG: SDR family NAD(P)-dependent oxidoreductase [bacterium]|nr:SDR family NAD(P)-dependent oxidoreductase [bacterium]